MAELTAEMIQRGPGVDPDLARRKRLGVQELRAVRERLTSSSGLQRAFDHELLRMFARQRSSAALTMVLLASTLAVVASNWIRASHAFVWLAVMCTTMMVSLILGRRFLEAPVQSIEISVWRRRFILAELLQGLSWAIFLSLLYLSGDSGAKMFLFFTVLTVSAATAMVSTTIANAVFASLSPMTVVLIVKGMPFDDITRVGFTVAAIGAQIYFVLLAQRQYKSAVAGLEFQSEKDALIAELEQAEANSDEARRRAEESNIAKSQFLATMSHELRTPLNAILGFSEVIKNELFGQLQVPAYKEYINDIHASGQHLLNLINEILDLSRVEAGRYELKEEAIDFATLVEERAATRSPGSDGDTANYAIILAYVWASTGFVMVVLSAALKGISQEVIEAARTDGATEWDIFRRIQFPLLSLPIAVVSVWMIINVIKVFDIVYIMTKGGPGGATRVIAYSYYVETFENGLGGYGAAVAVVMLALIIPVMIWQSGGSAARR